MLLVAIALCALVALGLYARFVVEVHRFADRRATGPAWSFPSHVYTSALVLEPGRPMPAAYLRAELEARDYREVGKPRRPGEWAARADGADVVLRGFPAALDATGGNGQRSAAVRLRIAGARLVDVRGARGAVKGAALEPVLFATLADSDRVMREWVPLSSIPKVVRDAVLASEDRRFYQHHGLDLRGNARALAANLRAGAVRQGASTITQQLARGWFLGRERSLLRKTREAALALGIESVFRKNQILEMYLNSVYFGPGDGERIAGVAEAAARYFDEDPRALTLDQAALLAGIIPAPSAYAPLKHPQLALEQRNRVLRDMVATGAIDAARAKEAMARPLGLKPTLRPPDRFPAFVDVVRQELATRVGRGAAEGWDLHVLTTLDPVWQQTAEDELMRALAARDPGGRDVLEGAFVALEPGSGAVRALVGGREQGPGEFNRARRAMRQPGSAFKPVVYAAALDPARGSPRLTPGSTVPDLRHAFDTPEGPWAPRNDDGEYHDTVTLAKALVHSLNVATANLVQKIGPATVSRYAERFGLGQPAPVASIGLGSQEVTPLALTAAYSVFATDGVRHEPISVRALRDARGRVLHAAPPEVTRVLDARSAALMRGLLEDVVIFGIAYPLRATFGFTRPCGGKTGTSNDYHDAWFVGFTPDVVAGVWVGYDVPKSLGGPAARVAIPVWAAILNRLLEGFPATPFPDRDDLVLAWIDPWTGGLARHECPSPLRVPFVKGTAPTAFCTRDHTADWEALRRRRLADSLGVGVDALDAGSTGGDSSAAPADSAGRP
ncbi:MAG TPA: PBP1A family penicillin-binding protein [Candidatus Saccharimonadaceae bacterium]|nr:PBP1A family penicillin-binding protein [Candidatus Saccharimonadaceae bacterium]